MLANLLPGFRSLHLDAVVSNADGIVLSASTKRLTARCPVCGHRSRRVHSRYRRTVADLPLAGKPVTLHIQTRRFYCQRPACPRRIFTERLPDLVAPHGRRSDGLRAALQQIGLQVGGEAGARLAHALGMLTSPDTLLRLVRAAALPTRETPLRLVGVDEWAWHKGIRYGTVLVDLEAHRVANLLPDRDADAVAAWFATCPRLEIISRDRGGLYADAATRGAPQAIQVADRFHLARNLGEALEKFLLPKSAPLKAAAAGVAAALIRPTEAAGPSNEMYRGKRRTPQPQAWRQRAEEEGMRRHAWHVTAYEAVCALHGKGAAIADIARQVGVSRRTVYRYLHLGAPPERKRPQRRERHVLEPYEPYLL
jgi:transposase